MKEKSKYLSYLLRHKPEQAGLTLTKEGWVLMQELVDNAGFTLEELRAITDSDNKGRYTIDGPRIRANQGHSTTQVQLTFKKAVPPVLLYHGTTSDLVPVIMKLVDARRTPRCFASWLTRCLRTASPSTSLTTTFGSSTRSNQST